MNNLSTIKSRVLNLSAAIVILLMYLAVRVDYTVRDGVSIAEVPEYVTFLYSGAFFYLIDPKLLPNLIKSKLGASTESPPPSEKDE